MDKRAVYRVNYYLGGQPASTFVCATSDNEAAAFLGIQDGSASVTRVAYPVEVDGLDAAHAPLPPLPVNVAPFQAGRLTEAEVQALRRLLAKGEDVGQAVEEVER